MHDGVLLRDTTEVIMRHRPLYMAVSILTIAMAGVLLFGHADALSAFTNLPILQGLLFFHLALKVAASTAAKPHQVAPGFDLDALKVDIVVPVYNEDPALLGADLAALAAQDRPPRAVWLIDDGSQRDGEPDLILEHALVRRQIDALEAAGVVVHTMRQPNQGKRWAQSLAFSQSDADIFVTIDSDTCLAPEALGKLLIPFSNPDVQSVAGFPMGQNYRKNLLTRAVDLSFTMSSLQGRMAEGFFGQVRVNCGILAAYRADTVRDNLPRYLTQRFMGAPVKAGDDRALTYFAKERGRAEFQPEAIAYSALPEKLSHLARQRLRWARSWCWGTLLLLRRPLTSPDFWFTFTQLCGILGFGLVVFIVAFGTITGATSPWVPAVTFAVALTIGAIVHLRYVVAAHPDDPIGQRVLTWLVSPFATLVYITLLLPLYYVAMLRPRPTRGWGTRRQVEVGLHDVKAAA